MRVMLSLPPTLYFTTMLTVVSYGRHLPVAEWVIMLFREAQTWQVTRQPISVCRRSACLQHRFLMQLLLPISLRLHAVARSISRISRHNHLTGNGISVTR